MERERDTHPAIFLYLSAFSKIFVSLPTELKRTFIFKIIIANMKVRNFLQITLLYIEKILKPL